MNVLETTLTCPECGHAKRETFLTAMPRRTIDQAAKESVLTCPTIRYYEEIGLVVSARRSAEGPRRYSQPEV